MAKEVMQQAAIDVPAQEPAGYLWERPGYGGLFSTEKGMGPIDGWKITPLYTRPQPAQYPTGSGRPEGWKVGFEVFASEIEAKNNLRNPWLTAIPLYPQAAQPDHPWCGDAPEGYTGHSHGKIIKIIGHGPDYRPCGHDAVRREEGGVCVEYEDGYRACFYESELEITLGPDALTPIGGHITGSIADAGPHAEPFAPRNEWICHKCGSMAINPSIHGRTKDVDLHLCDVCYWRKRAQTNVLSEALRESVQHKRGIYDLTCIEKGAISEYLLELEWHRSTKQTAWMFMLIVAEALQEVGL